MVGSIELASFFNLLLSFCAFIVLYCVYSFYKDCYWQKRGVPCEKPLPFFGNFKRVFMRECNVITLVADLYNKFNKEPYFGIQIFNKKILVLRDPDVVKNVLIKDFNVFDRRDFPDSEKIDPIAHNTLFASVNPKWKRVRSKISPVFTSGKIKLMFDLIKSCGEELESYMKKNQGKVFDMVDVCSRYTVDVITSCAFGVNANSFKSANPEFFKCGNRLSAETFINSFSQFSYFFAPVFVYIFKLKLLDGKATKFFSAAFWNTVKNRKQNKVQRNDLIDLMNEMTENSKDAQLDFDDDTVVSQAITFFSAGHDSTSTLISFVLYELALHPNIQKRLRKEIIETVQKHGGITYDSINDMKYLDMVVQEGLRKYPFAPLIIRKATQNYKIQSSGLVIERGTTVITPLCGLHYDEKYFRQSEKFDHERFSNENKINITPGTYLPFGDGPRSCIGNRFGLMSAKIGLVYALKNFEIEPCAETQIPIRFNQRSSFLRAEKGIHLKFKECKCV